MAGEQKSLAPAAAALLAQSGRLAQRPVVFAPVGSAVFTALEPKAALTAGPAADVLGGGPLDAAAMAGGLREQTALAREAGQRGVRLVADMDWLRPARAEPAAIAAFEAVLDRLAAELDATLICAYRRRSFPAAAISSALAVHSKTRGHDAAPRSSSSPRALGSGGFAARSTSASARWFRPPTPRRLSSETAPST